MVCTMNGPQYNANSSEQAGMTSTLNNGLPCPPSSSSVGSAAAPLPSVQPVKAMFTPTPSGSQSHHHPKQTSDYQQQFFGDLSQQQYSNNVGLFGTNNSAFTPIMRPPLSSTLNSNPISFGGTISNGPFPQSRFFPLVLPAFPSPPTSGSGSHSFSASSPDSGRIQNGEGALMSDPNSGNNYAGTRFPPPSMPAFTGPSPNVVQSPQLQPERSILQSPLENSDGGPNRSAGGVPRLPPIPPVVSSGPSGYRPPSMPATTASLPGRPPVPPGMLPPGLPEDFRRMGLQQQRMEARPVDLLADRHILPEKRLSPVEISLPRSVENPDVNCDPSIFRCTMTSMPQTQELLKKSRLPLGLVLHPFKDMKSLTILQVSVIVRCRACRTYINPFVSFTDSRHWKCNICFRINDLPDDFSWDPVTKSFGEPQRRPEIRYATIEFLAPQEYMPIRKNLNGRNELRPPQPAVYLFVLDVSANAVDTGYLSVFCERLLSKLDNIPGDKRTMVGFVTVDSGVHFYQFSEGSAEPKELVVTDLEDMFIPSYDGLLVNLVENKEMIREFVQGLPSVFESSSDTRNALGAAVKAAHQLIADVGGRITVMQTMLPNVGPGALTSREDPNLRSSNDVQNLGPATDYYKLLALECSGHQVAIDLFLLSSQYSDLATLAGMSKFCGGSIHHYPGIHLLRNSLEMKRFEKDLNRYFTRKIGFEAVLRIRCSKGLSLHTFHGNFFVRSTDLLALPNVNPDSAMGVRVQMEENLTNMDYACFQAALLYTSSRGDRRIRVHTLCLPVTNNLSEVHSKADVEAVMSLLSKLAVERSVNSNVTDAREALVNAVVDAYCSFSQSFPGSQGAGLLAPPGTLRFMPLFTLGLLKHAAFSFGASIKLDRRFFAMCQFLTLPLAGIMKEMYPELYPLHIVDIQEEEFRPPRYQLSYEKIDRHGVYLMDAGTYLYLYVGQAVSDEFCRQLFNVQTFSKIDEEVEDLPELDTPVSVRLREFISHLRSTRTFFSPLRIIREDSPAREVFIRRLVDDRSESSHSYVEFLQHLKREVSPK